MTIAMPAPAATPLIAAMTGFFIRIILEKAACNGVVIFLMKR